MDVYMSPEQVRTNAKALLNQKEELGRIVASLSSLVSELPGVWQDAAQQKFSSEFAQIKPEFDKFCVCLGDFAERARTHADKVEKESQIL